MNCHYHPEREVERECRLCHHLVCADCVVLVDAEPICKTCLSESLTLDQRILREKKPAPNLSQPQSSAMANGNQDRPVLNLLKDKSDALNAEQKSVFLTLLFSCLPGLGHYYLGLQKRGLNMMILFFAIIFLNTIVPSGLTFPVAIAIPILWFFSQFDALKYRTQVNEGLTVEDVPILPLTINSWLLIGLVFVCYGALAILYNVLGLLGLQSFEYETAKEFLFAVILLVIGYRLLRGKPIRLRGQREREDREHA